MLSDRLEKTLNKAFELAKVNEHEYATLEHLLFALIDDEDANEVLLSCNVDVEELRAILNDFINNELTSLKINKGSEVKPTASFQRVVQRAAHHVQMSGLHSFCNFHTKFYYSKNCEGRLSLYADSATKKTKKYFMKNKSGTCDTIF